MAKQACESESEPVILFFSVNFGCLKPEIGVVPLSDVGAPFLIWTLSE